MWHAFTGNPILTYKSLPSPRGTSAPWNAAAWSPDGKRVVIGGIGNIEVLDVASGKDIASYGYNSAIVHALAWSPDGRYIAAGSSTEMVQIWDIVPGKTSSTTEVITEMYFLWPGRPMGKGSYLAAATVQPRYGTH